MRTEVCVVLYDNSETVGALVDSLALLGPDIGLAAHDNGPDARTLPLVEQLATVAGLLFRGEVCADGNCGFAGGCNALAAGSAAEQLLFLNPDARILRWPQGLRADGRIVGPALVDANGRHAITYGTQRRLRDEVSLRWLRRTPARPRGRGYVSGAALLVGRDDFTALGGFDEGYFMYYEDIDLCHRAMDTGLQVVLEDDAVVQHIGGHSVGKSAAALRAAHLRSYRSGRRFHGSRGHALRGYDVLALVDAAARSALRLWRRSSRPLAAADWAVVREAARGLLRGGPRAS